MADFSQIYESMLANEGGYRLTNDKTDAESVTIPGNRLLDCVSEFVNSLMQNLVINREMLCYLFKCSGEAKGGSYHVGPRVVGLLFKRSPSAVGRLVIPVDVNSVQRVACWSATHV